MTRVSDFSQGQLLLAELNRSGAKLDKTQLQISSGKKAQYFKEIAEQAGVLLSAKRLLARNAHYAQTATELTHKLEMQNLGLKQLEGAAADLRQNVLDALANNSGLAFMENIDAVFRNALAALNTRINGQFMFAGTRADVPPVNVGSLADLAAAPTIASIFRNDDVKAAASVDEGTSIDYGLIASDLGTEIMTVLQVIKQFNDTNPDGPIDGDLTDGQRVFLDSQLATLKSVAENVTGFVAQNGVVQARVDEIVVRLSDTRVATEQFVSDIEDADLPSALTQLQQDQMAVQAAARMAATIGQLSLLDFLAI